MIPDVLAYKQELIKYIDKAPECLQRGIGLYISGEPGTGKTSITSIILRRFAELGCTSYFVSGPDVPMFWNKPLMYSEDVTVRQHLCDVAVLILDDLVLFPNTTNAMDNLAMERLIRERQHNNLLTIITSNYSLTDLRKCGIIYSLITSSMHRLECAGILFREKEEKEIKDFFG